MALLVAEHVTKRFGGLNAVRALDFTIDEGSIVSVIGPNGAGKTTFFNCIAGFYRIDEGSVRFGDVEIHALRPDQIASIGINRTYQNIRLFANMTAMENVLVGQHFRLHGTWIGAVLNTPASGREVASAMRRGGSSGSSDLRARATCWRTSCRMATSGAWRLPGPSRRSRSSSCSTNRPRA
jgi:branched-chain amino acid transport system ATP-binding protein